AERISANPPDEPTVPADQGGESRLIAVHDKALEQLAVAKAALGLPFDQLADTANQRAGLPGGHNANSPAHDFLLHTARRATNGSGFLGKMHSELRNGGAAMSLHCREMLAWGCGIRAWRRAASRGGPRRLSLLASGGLRGHRWPSPSRALWRRGCR